jgi:BMFP domain-containing protein YqiC
MQSKDASSPLKTVLEQILANLDLVIVEPEDVHVQPKIVMITTHVP